MNASQELSKQSLQQQNVSSAAATNITATEATEMGLIPLTLWMDLPNMFPWRLCVQEWNNIITVLNCFKVCVVLSTYH